MCRPTHTKFRVEIKHAVEERRRGRKIRNPARIADGRETESEGRLGKLLLADVTVCDARRHVWVHRHGPAGDSAEQENRDLRRPGTQFHL